MRYSLSFPEEKVTQALDAVGALRAAFPDFVKANGVSESVKCDLRGSAELGEVTTGTYSRKGIVDCLGHVVAKAITATSPGLAISESVYRKLPSNRRSPWKKRGAEVSYVLT